MILPAYITAMRSATWATMPRLWVISRRESFRSRRRRFNRSMNPASTITSRAVVGSSATRMSGSMTSPRASMTRWRMPPESWCGYSARRRGSTPSSLKTRWARASASARPVAGSCSRMVSRNCRSMRYNGLREVSGFWKAMVMARPRSRRTSFSFMARMSRPWYRMRPAVMRPGGRTRRRMERPRVDFPHPDSPTRPSASPSLKSRLASSTARTVPMAMG